MFFSAILILTRIGVGINNLRGGGGEVLKRGFEDCNSINSSILKIYIYIKKEKKANQNWESLTLRRTFYHKIMQKLKM